jgi:hypothetical protein
MMLQNSAPRRTGLQLLSYDDQKFLADVHSVDTRETLSRENRGCLAVEKRCAADGEISPVVSSYTAGDDLVAVRSTNRDSRWSSLPYDGKNADNSGRSEDSD